MRVIQNLIGGHPIYKYVFVDKLIEIIKMTSTKRDQIYAMLDFDNETIAHLYRSWDKSDCSDSGIIKILLIQTLLRHKQENKEYADTDQMELLDLLLPAHLK